MNQRKHFINGVVSAEWRHELCKATLSALTGNQVKVQVACGKSGRGIGVDTGYNF